MIQNNNKILPNERIKDEIIKDFVGPKPFGEKILDLNNKSDPILIP